MVHPDVRYNVVRRIHAQPTKVIQLPRHARLYADARIVVRGTVMGSAHTAMLRQFMQRSPKFENGKFFRLFKIK